jgi:phosphoserine phosphatase
MATILSIDGILDRIKEQLDLKAHGSTFPFVVFDADNTLWKADLGEISFEAGIQRGLIREALIGDAFWEWAAQYEIPRGPKLISALEQNLEDEKSGKWLEHCTALGHTPIDTLGQLYEMQAWVFAGQRPESLVSLGKTLYQEHLGPHVFQYVAPLFEELHRLGVQTRVVTASHHFIARGACEQLGLEHHQVFGMEPVLNEEGQCLPTLKRAPYGLGKQKCIEDEIGFPALAAFGDSVSTGDSAMLDAALIPVAVYPSGQHRVHALAQETYLILQ